MAPPTPSPPLSDGRSTPVAGTNLDGHNKIPKEILKMLPSKEADANLQVSSIGPKMPEGPAMICTIADSAKVVGVAKAPNADMPEDKKKTGTTDSCPSGGTRDSIHANTGNPKFPFRLVDAERKSLNAERDNFIPEERNNPVWWEDKKEINHIPRSNLERYAAEVQATSQERTEYLPVDNIDLIEARKKELGIFRLAYIRKIIKLNQCDAMLEDEWVRAERFLLPGEWQEAKQTLQKLTEEASK
ncbi:hypothetical protein IWZ01DRAFT_545587 [Phyllosticta capitalensis]